MIGVAHADNPAQGPYYAPNTSAYGFVSLANYDNSGKLAGLYNTSGGDFSGFLNKLFKFALAIGAMAAVLRLVYAGYLYMGSDLWTQKSSARIIIGDVTLGLLLLLAIWLILYQINPDILSLNALKNITAVPPQSASTQSNMQQFTNSPAPNSFFGGAGGQYDSSNNGCGVNGCDTFNPNPVSP